MFNSSDSFLEELGKILTSKSNIKNYEQFYKDLLSSDIYIYGAGNAGTMTYQLLIEGNIKIQGFIDKRADEIKTHFDKPVYSVENRIKKENVFIVIAFICSQQELAVIKKLLLESGYKKILYYHDIYNYFISKKYFDKQLNNSSLFSSEQEKIYNVGSYLCDDKSRLIYYNFFDAIMFSDPEKFSQPDTEIQYFVSDIPFKRGYSRFIDCGAFDGDTAFMLKKCKGSVQKIALFEPDSFNFKKLRENLDKQSIAEEEVLFPCGVWNKTEMLKFKSGIQTTSGISESGEVYVQCVALDDVLENYAPTFIKMDIEGAEYEALLGAEKMIKEYKPDLAISVYHNIEHMWEIPLLIKQFNPDYKLYLRSHGLHGMETILYAVNKD